MGNNIRSHALGREYSNEFRSPNTSANLPSLHRISVGVGSQVGTYQPARKARGFEQTPVGQKEPQKEQQQQKEAERFRGVNR